MKQREFSMEDPGQRTQFHHAIAAKLCGIADEIERENYLKEAARKYYVDEGGLRRLVASYGRSGAAESVWRDGTASARSAPDRPAGARAAKDPDETERRNERLLLTWLADEPEIFAQISPYIQPEHFHEGVYRQAAEGYWRILSEQGGGNPASVIGMFETEQEHETAASLFNTRLKGLHAARDREKALRDIVISVRTSAADRQQKRNENSAQEPTAEEVRDMIQTRRDLQALRSIRFHLADAP
jgi:DNA primase